MTAAVILAGGGSSRFGEPKQKILYKGKSLLKHVIDTAIDAGCQPVITILGAFAEEIHADIEKEKVNIFHNPQWEEGMSSSIRLGIEMLKKTETTVSEVIVMVCDQPFVTTELLNHLISEKAASGKDIVACSYNYTLGVPVLFDKKIFPELLLLKGDEGAKKLLTSHEQCVAAIPFPLGNIDIDTKEDYKALTT